MKKVMIGFILGIAVSALILASIAFFMSGGILVPPIATETTPIISVTPTFTQTITPTPTMTGTPTNTPTPTITGFPTP